VTPEGIRRLLERVRQLQRLHPKLDRSTSDPGNVEQVVNDSRHVEDLAIDHVQRPLVRSPPPVGASENPRSVLNGRARVTQLVGQHGQELVLASVGGCQLSHAGIEIFFQLLAAGRVLDGEQDERTLIDLPNHTPGVQHHDLPADADEIVLDHEVIEGVVSGQDLPEKPP